MCFLFGLFVLCQLLHADVIEDRDCLTCHKDPSLTQPLTNGRIRSLYVDPRDWRTDVHRVYGMSCIDCHVDATPFSHPVGGFHGEDCDVCHSEECEEFAHTVHAIQHGTEPIPACFDCHTKHSIRRKDDAEASIYRKKIASVCSPCHPSEVASKSWLNTLVFFRVSGHKKEDVSGRYDMSQCINCHFKDGAHGQPGVVEERCAICHRKEAGIEDVFSRSVHVAAVFGNGTFVRGINIFYAFLFVAIVGSIAAICMKRTTCRGKKSKDSTT